MEKKKSLVVIIVLALVVVILAAVILFKKPGEAPVVVDNPVAPVGDEVGTGVIMDEPEVPVDEFRAEVPVDIKVPEMGEQLSEAERKIVAVPTVVTAAAPGVESKFRSFDIKAENGKFEPSRIIGRVGDTIHVNFTAVDKEYDIVFPSYSMKQTAKAGQTKVLEFSAVIAGNFTYYCELCGGPESTARGNIIIAE